MTIARPRRRKQEDVGFALFLSLFTAPVITVIYGAVLATMWGWFVSDTFHVMRLSLGQAYGLAMVAKFVTYQHGAEKKDENRSALETWLETVFFAVTWSLLTLGTGWLVHLVIS